MIARQGTALVLNSAAPALPVIGALPVGVGHSSGILVAALLSGKAGALGRQVLWS